MTGRRRDWGASPDFCVNKNGTVPFSPRCQTTLQATKIETAKIRRGFSRRQDYRLISPEIRSFGENPEIQVRLRHSGHRPSLRTVFSGIVGRCGTMSHPVSPPSPSVGQQADGTDAEEDEGGGYGYRHPKYGMDIARSILRTSDDIAFQVNSISLR